MYDSCTCSKLHNWALQGLELELCTDDRVGLLSDITRVFRKNNLSIKRALISTKGGKAKDTFYVTDVAGKPVDLKIIESMRREIGLAALQVKQNSSSLHQRLLTKKQRWGISSASRLERFKT